MVFVIRHFFDEASFAWLAAIILSIIHRIDIFVIPYYSFVKYFL